MTAHTIGKRNKAARTVVLLFLCISLVLTGCSVTKKTDQLQNYQQQMEDFADQVENYTRQIGSLHPSEETASTEASTDDTDSASTAVTEEEEDESSSSSDSRDLSDSEAQFLELIDKLADACQTAADQTVPRDYAAAGSLCRKANNSMQSAKANYHSAFESAAFNEADFNAAQSDYADAMDSITSLMQYFQNYGKN